MAAAATARRSLHRIRTRAAFAALRHGRRARCGVVAVSVLDGQAGAGDGHVAVAFAVGRAVGPAVVRNRIRRRLRAAVAELSPAPGAYLLAVSPAAADRSFAQLRDDLTTALVAAGALPADRS